MATASNALITGIDIDAVVDLLDRLYCYNMRAFHWAQAVVNRLEGEAALVLTDELKEVADDSLAMAQSLAARIGELGGAITADPTEFVARSLTGPYTLPADHANVVVILAVALQQTRAVLALYKTFLTQTRGQDELTHRLLLKLAQ